MAGVLVQVGVLVGSVVGLGLGARLLVDAVVRLARRVGLSEIVIGLTVVAAGTSSPELVVTTDAALKGFGDIAVGNVVGSNLYNVTLVLGVVSLVQIVRVKRSLVHRDGVALVVSSLLVALAVFDLSVSRAEGALLVGLLVAYLASILWVARSSGGSVRFEAPTSDSRPDFRGRDAGLLVVGLAVVLVSGDVLVGTAVSLARTAGVSELVIGGTIVAAGTSTPEFAVSLVAMRRGSLGVSVGNVVGSNVFNSLGILGVAAVVRPLSVAPAALDTVAWMVIISVAVVAALWTGRRLSRPEGGLLAVSEAVRWVVGLLGWPG